MAVRCWKEGHKRLLQRSLNLTMETRNQEITNQVPIQMKSNRLPFPKMLQMKSMRIDMFLELASIDHPDAE